ncbi:hypothetical protein [Flavobacterium sp. 140616W15]|uniref:hypothetical protein n=1 Tax=Flavobacterium sp. 140616W15 TaxID=2478552 RepID=UPI000F0C5993|nr:hypothetical protein [Flavobacterium sp. 140616W15]AYN04421.1 hypothetical protein EAG11_09700 [Flavobacterium sp. 140616W15]
MKNTILIISFLMFLSCKEKDNKSSLVKIKNINGIVETIIDQDSLKFSRNKLSPISLFCEDLIKINIHIPESTDKQNIPSIPFNNVSINDLLNSKIERDFFFSKSDSSYLVSQNLGQKEFKIEQKIIDKINSTTFEKEKVKQENRTKYDFYQMTIPVFSNDMTKAYVELNHFCGGLCGDGKAFFLSKINGKWRIINKHRTWVS